MTSPPALESRFLPPHGWRTGDFTSPAGQKIHYGFILPDDAKAAVVGLQGLNEFTEKYYETARDMLDRGFGFFMMDWPGQGRSGRYLETYARHAVPFEQDTAALQQFITDVVRPAAGDRKLVMLAHSMGAHLGLRHLLAYPGTFACAALTAPMTGLQAIWWMPAPLAQILTALLNRLVGRRPTGSDREWKPYDPNDPSRNIYSRDPVRGAVYNAWCAYDPALRSGNVTYGWVYEAYRSCLYLRLNAASIDTPCVLALAGHEKLVDNDATQKIADVMPDARILYLGDSWHEILMERDSIRKLFYEEFDALLERSGIS